MWASLVLELERTCILLLPLMPVTVPGRLMSECRRELRLAFSGGDCNTYRKRDPRSGHVNHTHQRELESTPFNVTAKTTLDYLQDANSFANPHVQYPIIALDNIRNKKKYLCRSGSVFPCLLSVALNSGVALCINSVFTCLLSVALNSSE